MTKNKKILIIDDDYIAVEALQMILLEEGYEVISANVGEIGLNMVNKEKPDVVILDIKMPGMDGCKVCEKIKSNPDTKNIKVLMLTGFSTDEYFDESIKMKADWYILKPYEVCYMLKILDKLLNKL